MKQGEAFFVKVDGKRQDAALHKDILSTGLAQEFETGYQKDTIDYAVNELNLTADEAKEAFS